MMNNYEEEILRLKEELGVDLLPKYLTPTQQHRLMQSMLEDIQEEESKLADNT
jgi:hypothetical protein